MKPLIKPLAAVLAGSLASAAVAEQREEILKVKKSTFVNLVDLLVQRGVINKQEGTGLVSAAEEEAASEEKRQASAPAAASSPNGEKSAQAGAIPSGEGKNAEKSQHVGYVPEFIKREIRDQVKAELKAEVVKDVKAEAKTEKWGIPGALPEWVSSIKPYFDMRIRLADEFYGSDNVEGFDNRGTYDWLQINEDGGLYQSMLKNKAFFNNQKDRLRLRERFRVGFDAQITEGLKSGFRFATSNQFNPVSNDQTLGNTGQSYEFAIDRAFLEYDFVDDKGRDWFTLWGGRFANPFVSTDVVYDPDLSFEGVAGTFRLRLNRDDPTVRAYHAPDPTERFGINLGPQTPDSVFATLGVFPIEEVNFSTSDKWLFGGQIGADWLVFDESRLKIATSYYDYHNINARKNQNVSLHENDWTAPQFVQKGNSMVTITDYNPLDLTCNDPNDQIRTGCLFGLASGFEIFNATAMFDYAGFAPTHVLLTTDYAKNLGYDKNHIAREFNSLIRNYDDNRAKTSAYQVRLDVGNPQIRRFKDWNVSFAYRYVERDAVLDAFTDSIFHQGGTNAKGWVMGVQYGLARNTWLNLRWFSTDAIDGPTYSVDTLNLDLNARF